MNKEERSKEARTKLVQCYKKYIYGAIGADDFIEQYEIIMKYAEKYNLPRSRGERQDERDTLEFFDKIYDTAWREFYSIGEWLLNEFRFKGHRIQLFPTDEFGIGMPDIVADDRPDYLVKVQLNSRGKWKKQYIDSKSFRMEDKREGEPKEIIFIKDKNIKSYCKYNSAIFIATHTRCLYLPRTTVKEIRDEFTPCMRPHHYKNGHFMYGNTKKGKKGIEISDREGSHISIDNLFENFNCEVWYKNAKRIVWTGPLKEFNGGT